MLFIAMHYWERTSLEVKLIWATQLSIVKVPTVKPQTACSGYGHVSYFMKELAPLSQLSPLKLNKPATICFNTVSILCHNITTIITIHTAFSKIGIRPHQCSRHKLPQRKLHDNFQKQLSINDDVAEMEVNGFNPECVLVLSSRYLAPWLTL